MVAVRDQTGAWDAAGQTRTLQLSNGGTVVETVQLVDRPGFFAYELTGFTGLFGLLVDHARAEWRFDAADGGTLITWTYSFEARRGCGGIVALIVRFAWAGYMRRVMDGLVAEVRRVVSG